MNIEIWLQDEARIGRKNTVTRPRSAIARNRLPGEGWAKRGTRPSAPRDQRARWAYMFGAIRPARGEGAAIVAPYADTEAMRAHLVEISAAGAPGARAAPILDQAGWRTSAKLIAPDNITLTPPRSPELNPVENIWRFMPDNWLSNRVFAPYDEIVALCCEAWNKLIDQPWRITSIGRRKWAYRS